MAWQFHKNVNTKYSTTSTYTFLILIFEYLYPTFPIYKYIHGTDSWFSIYTYTLEKLHRCLLSRYICWILKFKIAQIYCANYIYPVDTARVSLTVITCDNASSSLLGDQDPVRNLRIILTQLSPGHELKSKQTISPRNLKYFSVSVIIFGQFESHLDVRSQTLTRN